MGKYGRDPDDIAADIAYANGEGMDILEYLQQQARARGWNGGQDDE